MAEYAVADARFCFPIPAGYPDEQAAPLMCAGLIGYRALRMCGEARRIGLYGFGASAHILAQVCSSQGREVYAFTRPGDEATQAFARELGAVWAGGSEETPPQPLDCVPHHSIDGARCRATRRAWLRRWRPRCSWSGRSRLIKSRRWQRPLETASNMKAGDGSVRCVQMPGAGPMILICEDQESEGARACPEYAPDQAPGQGLSQRPDRCSMAGHFPVSAV